MELLAYHENNLDVLYEQVLVSEQTPLKVVDIVVPANELSCQVPKHWHRSIEIIIPKESGTELWLEGEIHKIYPNDLFVINSQVVHACCNVFENKKYHGYAIQIKYDFIKRCYEDIDNAFFKVSANPVQKKELLKICQNIINAEKSQDPLKRLQIYSYACELMYQLLSHHCSQKNEHLMIDSERKKEQLIKVLTYLDEHADEAFDAKEIAKHFHLSYGYLAYLFKTYLNTTMKSYVDSVRLNHAEIDLLNSDKAITDIAFDHGFPNTKSFYREFYKYHDMTPKQYRKSFSHK